MSKVTDIINSYSADPNFKEVWPNTVRADAAIVYLRDFYYGNSTEDTSRKCYLAGVQVNYRIWNDIYHVRQAGQLSFEQQFVQMFDELGTFLLAQSSDDLLVMTLRTGVARYHLAMATDLTKVKTWGAIAHRAFPIIRNW